MVDNMVIKLVMECSRPWDLRETQRWQFRVKTGPIQKHLRRKKLVVKLVDLLLLCDYCTILNVQYLIFSLIIAYCTPLELKEKWLHSKIIFLGYKNEVSIIQWGYAVVFKIIFIHIQQMTTNHGEFPLWLGFKKQR